MDWTLLQSLWDWLLPAGWLATAIAWWRDRKVYQVRAVKETEGTYGNRTMGEPPIERNRSNILRAGPDLDGELLGECGAVAEPE